LKDAIRRDTTLTFGERLVAITIARHTDDDLHGGSRYKLSAATIATEIGASLRIVQGAIRTLSECGWLAPKHGHFTIVGHNLDPAVRAYRQRRDEGRETRTVIRAERREMRAELSHPIHLAFTNDSLPRRTTNRQGVAGRHM
jgi:hypothetical protein